MANQKAFNITLRGETINGAKIGNFKKKLSSVNDTLTQWANAGACQLVIGGNANWLKDLFEQDEMRLMNGKLSAKGREVASYIRAFAPITIAEKNGTVEVKLTKNKKNKGVFFLLEKDENGAPIKVDAAEKPEWPLTLREYINMTAAGDGAPQPSNKKASTLAGQLEKMAAMLRGEKEGVEVTGTVEELAVLYQNATAVATAALEAVQSAKTQAEGVETETAGFAASVTSRAETRADVDREAASA